MPVAEVILIGHVHEISASPLTYDTQRQTVDGNTSSYEVTRSRRLRVVLDVKLMDNTKGQVIWRESNMIEKATFKVSTDPLSNRFNQKQALERITGRLAKRIYLKTMERF